jgi:superfamily I DNA and RNA helicase
LGVGVHPYPHPEDQAKCLADVIGHLLTLGFAPDEIAILSLRGVGQSPLWQLERIGRHAIQRFTGAYQPDGTQIWSRGDITLDSLFRFKGQESPAIILADIEDQKSTERLDRLLYCGMSRATVRLDMLVGEGSQIQRRLMAG